MAESKDVSAATDTSPAKRKTTKRAATKKAVGKQKHLNAKEKEKKISGPAAALNELEAFKKSADEVAARIRQQMLDRIDGVTAKLTPSEEDGKMKKRAKKIRGKLKGLKLKPEKGRMKDLRRMARILDQIERYSEDDK